VSDEVVGHHHSKNFKTTMPWPEHPDGQFDMVTNNLGFREDNPTKEQKAQNVKRILITGDSHIDGVLSNKDSYPNVLEALMNASDEEQVEVINAGNGFYSFKNYYGLLEKYKYLKPDVYIVTVYLGNDFIENLIYEEDNLEFFRSPLYAYYRMKKKFIRMRTGLENSQHTNQAVFFSTYPSKIDETVSLSGDYLSKIKSICDNNDIDLEVVILPSSLEVDSSVRERFKKAGWDKSTLGSNIEIKNRFIEVIKSKKISFFDLSNEFSSSDQKLYWDTDSHLNISGHKLAAQLILERIR
jgi:hypothetical protein